MYVLLKYHCRIDVVEGNDVQTASTVCSHKRVPRVTANNFQTQKRVQENIRTTLTEKTMITTSPLSVIKRKTSEFGNHR